MTGHLWSLAVSLIVAQQLRCWSDDFEAFGPLFGAQINNLQIASVSAAYLHWRFRDDWDGVLAQVSPGLAGGKVSIGYGLGTDIGFLPKVPLFGYEIKASYLKTWWPKLNRIPSESLAGVELSGTFAVNVTCGLFQAIDRVRGSKGTRFSIGGGIGF